MSKSSAELAASLRKFARSGQSDAARVLPGLLAGMDAAGSQDAAAHGEFVWLLGQCLRTLRDVSLVPRVLQCLVATGRLGRALAALFVQARTLPLPKFSPLLLALPQRQFLLLLNEMLLDSPAGDKPFAAWLKGLLPVQSRLDAKEALLFLKALADEGLPLARPLRDALLAAGLAEALAKAFAGTPGPGTAEALLQADEVLASPAIHEEALGYALRTAGNEGQSRLGPLLAAAPELAVRDQALVAEMRRLAVLPEAPALLCKAAQAEPEVLGAVLADMLKNPGPQRETALALAPLLPRSGLASALADLPAAEHGPVLGQVFLALARHDSDLLRRAAKAQAASLDQATAQALARLLTNLAEQDAAAWGTTSGAVSQPPAAQAKPAGSRQRPLAEALKNALGPIKDEDFAHSVLSEENVEGVAFSAVNLSHSHFQGVRFRRARFSACQLSGAVFEDCTFNGCAFTGSDFAGASFRGCRLEDCSLDSCDLSRARLHGSLLLSCSLTDCSLAGAQVSKARLDSVSLRACALSGARLHEAQLAHSALARCDFTGSIWDKTLCRDVEYVACGLAQARLRGCEFTAVTFLRCALPGVDVMGGHTDNPHLAAAAQACRARSLVSQKPEPLPLPLTQGPGAAFVAACVERCLRVDEARRTLAAMRGQDQRRRELALSRLTEAQGEFLRLLPLLLVTDVFEKAQGLPGVPACSLAGRGPSGSLSRAERALLEQHFPGQEPTSGTAAVLAIEAVYAIGSLGSVAQKPSSDIDCWVCYSVLEGAGKDARGALQQKLAGVEAWAAETLALEVHFFAMPLSEVRANAFGMSDKESSGSAQAALLKEEFYRTALKLAGKDLAWWAAAPAADQAAVQALLAHVAELAPRLAAELVDLGQPDPIPPEEYFGACLWQIVKALHSPYKSVMKLALLEKYAGQSQTMRLLCDRIKEAVMRGRSRLEEVDPYLSLFSSIRKHYHALGDTASLGLIGECLRLKADVDPEHLPPELGGQAAESGLFARSMRLGGLVNQFMIAAYRRIQEDLRADRAAARITPQDMTRLGRRIAANFAQHEHKVSLVPFLSEGLAFTELFFYAEKAPGKRTIWGVKGKEQGSGKAAVESLAPIRRDTDMARLLAWILVNGIYDPRLTVQAEKTLAPIAVADLQNLLADLAAFFPRREILEPDMEEYLEPERVTRIHLILNLPVPPETNKVALASAIYATNWGELFCQSFESPASLLSLSPLTFLRENLARPVPARPELKIFIPKRSACPKIKAF